MRRVDGPAYVYILRCRGGGAPPESPQSGTLYTGWTMDVGRRLAQHQAGRGGRYTRSHLPVELAYQEECATREEAMRRECEIKRMTREEKLALIGRGKPSSR
ncbi:MAG: GIY-YIG nuclease family protein [Fretibacterium sp.]|nr:GIY-YIG nuclease family protein [Fretibacterium sp.]